jgi:6-pyruvoyltetrahydropterin/6-carboxytetrahydropterin synthase
MLRQEHPHVIEWVGTIDSAHFIPGHPKCGRLHGHTYKIEIAIGSDTLPEAHPRYLLDYGAIKEIVNAWDHRLLLPLRHKGITLTEEGGYVTARWAGSSLRLPHNHVCQLDLPETSSEYLAQVLAAQMMSVLQGEASKLAVPPKCLEVAVSISETPNTRARAWALYRVATEVPQVPEGSKCPNCGHGDEWHSLSGCIYKPDGASMYCTCERPGEGFYDLGLRDAVKHAATPIAPTTPTSQDPDDDDIPF